MEIISLLERIDIVNLLAMVSLFWILYGRLDRRFEQIEKRFDKIDARFDKVDIRFDKLEEKVTDIDRRLCRMEGAFSQKECCMLKHDGEMKKAG